MKQLSLVKILFIPCFIFLSATLFSQRNCATMEVDAQLRSQYPELGPLDNFEVWLKEKIDQKKQSNVLTPAQVYTIPVVFHIVHTGEPVGQSSNISQAQVQSQIQVLNEDFRKILGTNGYNTNPNGADTEIEFCAAQVDENGNVMNEPGINRINRSSMGWASPPYSSNYIDGTIKPNSIWNPDDYFNIWVCDLGSSLLGYAQFPSQSGLSGINANGGPANTDGVVVTYYSVGAPPANPYSGPFNYGRTATHEIGHWLGLRHIWGDQTCGSDYCNDTPTHYTSNLGCPGHPKSNSCGTSDEMFENYMDYTDDICMNIFTNDQTYRMRTVLENSPRRNSLLSSTVCAISAGDPPICNFSISDVSIHTGENIDLTDLTENDPTSWNWTFTGGSPSSSTLQNPQNISFSNAGTYEITLMASNGEGTCQVTQIITVTNEVDCSALGTGVEAIDISCFGENDGSIALSPFGGTPVYSYAWSNGETSSMITNLSEGSYIFTITDANACTFSSEISIAEPDPLEISFMVDSVLCYGLEGEINTEVNGGTTPYDYSWNVGSDQPSLDHILAGNYTVTVSDANNCSITSSVELMQPNAIEITTTVNEGSCNDTTSASAVLEVSGGTGSYQYNWNPAVSSGNTANNLDAGFYSVTVMDDNSCMETTTFQIHENSGLTVSVETENASCTSPTGTAEISVGNGITPFTYNWAPSISTSNIGTDLETGNYSVTITDVAGCIGVINFTIESLEELNIEIQSENGGCDGSLSFTQVTPLNGTSPFDYVWSPNVGNSNVVVGLEDGIYYVSVTDANGCMTTDSVEISNSNALSTSLETHNPSCDSIPGWAEVTPNSGSTPYSYSWSGNVLNSDQGIAINLGADVYSVTVTDANGCSDTVQFELVQGACCPYSIVMDSITCTTDTFCVTLYANESVANGIDGMNFCLSYDPDVMTPTGNTSLGSVVYGSLGGPNNGEQNLSNINVPGYVFNNIYYDANVEDGTYWYGNGEVICIEFVISNSVQEGTYSIDVCELEESYQLTEISKCAEVTNLAVPNFYKMEAKIVFEDYDGNLNTPEKPFIWDQNNPNEYLITTITNTPQTQWVNTNMSGSFTWDLSYGNHVIVDRDIPGSYFDDPNDCEDVFLFINGADAYYAQLIASFDQENNLEGNLNWVPSPYQMIAADVNMNDKVRANDVTLILDRSSLNRCEFPQVWNYTEGTIDNPMPSLDSIPSKDWRFIDQDSLSAFDFQADMNYPVYFLQNATSGYWRDDVPNVPDSIQLTEAYVDCPVISEKTLNGILLGDVNASWNDSSGLMVKTNDVANVHFKAVETNNNQYEVYVAVNGSDICHSIDFKMKYNTNKLQLSSVQSTAYADNLSFVKSWNNQDEKGLLLSSYAVESASNDEHLFKLQFEALEDINIEDFGNITALMNGSIVSSSVSLEKLTSSKNQFNIEGGYINIYPQPAKDYIQIDMAIATRNDIVLNIYDQLGQMVAQHIYPNAQKLQSQQLNVSTFKTGTYIVEIRSDEYAWNRKLIIQ